MGIGLSRLLCLPYVPEDSLVHLEIMTALSSTVDANIGRSHCLCHGDLGNSELLLQAAAKLGQPIWAARAANLAQTVRADIEAQGWKCGTPLGIQTPSLMVGLAGIGYGMLRNAQPHRIPAVMAMQLQ
jgi:lantibiotic modifying enzyme